MNSWNALFIFGASCCSYILFLCYLSIILNWLDTSDELKVTCLENLTLHGILSLSYNISVMHHLQSLWHPKIEEHVSKHFLSWQYWDCIMQITKTMLIYTTLVNLYNNIQWCMLYSNKYQCLNFININVLKWYTFDRSDLATSKHPKYKTTYNLVVQ